MKKLDLRRKIQIILGSLILLGSLIFKSSIWPAGAFLIAAGIFNFCPTCTNCDDGQCEIDKGKEKKE